MLFNLKRPTRRRRESISNIRQSY